MSVYFIQAGDAGLIKIGVAANVRQRLKGLQCGNHLPLRLLAVVDGGRPEEVALHLRFSKYRVQGEWFEPSDEILSFAGTVDLDALAAPEPPDPRLLAEVERFLRLSGVSATAFGRNAVNDPLFVFNIRHGRECGAKTCHRVRGWMNAYRAQTEVAA